MLTLTRKVGSSVIIYERATMKQLVKITLTEAQGDTRTKTGWCRLTFEADKEQVEIKRDDFDQTKG